MEWTRQVDAYCERMGAGFWAEPVNALTNLAFLVAAVAAGRAVARADMGDLAMLWLLAVMVAIGVGSFLFHTVATVWAALADVLPITVFILSYLALTVRRGFERPWWQAIGVALLFLPAGQALETGVGALVGDALGGSEGYLPALLALFVCGIWLDRRRHALGRPLLGAAVLFLVSLTFRTIDEPLCPVLPLGTHFAWHILNGVLLAWLVVSLVRHAPPRARDRLSPA